MTSTRNPDPRLARSRALVVGVGGLGAPAAAALARAGVGTLGLIDPDVVELSNLHRQPLYDASDIGRPKVEVAALRLRSLAPGLRVECWRRRFEAGTAHPVGGFDVVLDGTDTVAAKFEVNDAAVAAGVPLVHAGVLGLRAQVMTVLPGASACYRCVFEEPPPAGEVLACEEAGVLGPVPALAGALVAAEALRLLTGAPPRFAGRLLVIDVRAGRWRTVVLTPSLRCSACAAASGVHPLGRSEAR
jgi:adenylyltransferase/sulfurtransferase